MTTSYAYLHCKPDGTPFYVGKGALRRAKYLGDRNPHHKATVNKYGASNILKGWLECSNDQVAYELEIGLIKCLRRMGVELTNFTDGGEGGRNPTPETRQRLSEAAKKRGVSEACHAARVKAKKGVPLSAEQKEKQALAMKGKVFTEEHRKNISISAKKRGVSPEILAKAHAASRGRKQSEEERKQRADAVRAAKQQDHSYAVYVNEVYYRTRIEAALAIGVSSGAITYALNHSGIVKKHKIRKATNDN